MLEALEIPDIRKQVAPITIERYHRMIALGLFDEWKVELLNGVLVEKMSKSELHIFLVQLLYRQLVAFCPESKFLVRKEDPITIGDSEPEPDVSVVAGQLSDFRYKKPTSALFVIGVAVSSLAVDRVKARDYARAEIPEYWIVRPEDECTEVYRLPRDGEFADVCKVPSTEDVESVAMPGFSFNLAQALAE